VAGVAGVAVAVLFFLPAYAGTFSGSPISGDGVGPDEAGEDPDILGGDDVGDVVPVPSIPVADPTTGLTPRCKVSSAPDADFVLLPTATGTVRSLPEMRILERAPVADDVQSTYFRTTLGNREFRRGFFEFDLPAEPARISSAVLVLTETRGWVSNPMPPDLHELSFYAADGAVTTEDYDRPTLRCASFETDVNEPTAVFAFDVTALLRRFDRQGLGFRVKLAGDPQLDFMGFAGSDFGTLHNLAPQIRVVLKP